MTWFVMLPRDRTDVASCCSPRVPVGGVSEPRSFRLPFNEKGGVDIVQPWSDLDPYNHCLGPPVILVWSSEASKVGVIGIILAVRLEPGNLPYI